MMAFLAGLTIAIGVLQIVCLAAVFWGMVELRAMQKSTHSIQYVPVEPKFQGMTDEVKQALSKDLFDNVV
jgi:hypothetical protein